MSKRRKLTKEDYEKKNRERAENNWNFMKKWMSNNGCSCGERELSKLSFHHTDPTEKDKRVRQYCGYSGGRIISELQKCVVKCRNCHETINHGSPEDHERNLIEKYLKAISSKKQLHRNKLLIWFFKKTQKCHKCNNDNPVHLLFHHINSKNKRCKMGEIYYYNTEIINKELSKTICLCHNCHQSFHQEYGHTTTFHQLEEYLGEVPKNFSVDIRSYIDEIPSIFP